MVVDCLASSTSSCDTQVDDDDAVIPEEDTPVNITYTEKVYVNDGRDYPGEFDFFFGNASYQDSDLGQATDLVFNDFQETFPHCGIVGTSLTYYTRDQTPLVNFWDGLTHHYCWCEEDAGPVSNWPEYFDPLASEDDYDRGCKTECFPGHATVEVYGKEGVV